MSKALTSAAGAASPAGRRGSRRKAARFADMPWAQALAKWLIRALVLAAFLAAAKTMMIPMLTPRLDAWVYRASSISLEPARYFAMAAETAVANGQTNANDRVTVYRLFCGWFAQPDVKPAFCVMHEVRDDETSKALDRKSLHDDNWEGTLSSEGLVMTSPSGSTARIVLTNIVRSGVEGGSGDRIGGGSGCVRNDDPKLAEDRRQALFHAMVGSLNSIRSGASELEDTSLGSNFERDALAKMKLGASPSVILSQADATTCPATP